MARYDKLGSVDKNKGKRKKSSIRDLFSRNERKFILSKSDKKCSHCGKPLDVDTMTVEHVIPIAKGGDNRTANLVALCEECNKSKSNALLDPKDYYPYLGKIHKEALCKYFESYESVGGWLDISNILALDSYVIPNYSMVLDRFEPDSKGLSPFFAKWKKVAESSGKYLFQRARFKDRGIIKEFYKGIGESLGWSDCKVAMEEVESYLLNGSVYMLFNAKKVLIGLYYFGLDIVAVEGKPCIAIHIGYRYSISNRVKKSLHLYITNLLMEGVYISNSLDSFIVLEEELKTKGFVPCPIGDSWTAYNKQDREIVFAYNIYGVTMKSSYFVSFNARCIADMVCEGSEVFERLTRGTEYSREAFDENFEESSQHFCSLGEDPYDSCFFVGTLIKKRD